MRALTSSLAAAALAAGLSVPAAAHDVGADVRSIIVTGIGEASRAPDMALLTIGVETEGPTASEALRKNSAQMEATLKTLRDAGVDKKDIQTSNLSVGAKYDYSREGAPPRIVGYQATNTVSVKLRDLGKAGAVIDRAVGVGANRLDSISFGFTDPKPVMNEARKDAVVDARSRAELYADAAGVKLGKVLRIADSFTPGPGPIPMMARMEMDAAAQSVPISPGESTMSATVTIVYAID